VLNLGQDADVLIHEAAGGSVGHSSAAQAGANGKQAGARSLYLIHYNPARQAELKAEAESTYGSPVTLTQDFMVLKF
jgi:ribonuclease BN (tRNA processing enzyme)